MERKFSPFCSEAREGGQIAVSDGTSGQGTGPDHSLKVAFILKELKTIFFVLGRYFVIIV